MSTGYEMTVRKFLTAAVFTAAAALPLAMATATPAHAGIFISVGIAPPALPVYVQPICPGDGYLWTPGYWAYAQDGGYYWVPGTWVRPPRIGVLWTPGYWGWGGNAFLFHAGYWGPHIGFYGGVNYGFGYGGLGYEGGYWRNGAFAYNRTVNNITNVNVTNVYNKTVVVNNNVTNNRVSYNGGNGGVNARPQTQELVAQREQHVQPTSEQVQHQNFAAQNPQQRFNTNHGTPAITAAATPASFRANPTNPQAAARPTAREGNQDQRIANGLKSGQMTSGEAAKAEQNQSRIDQQVHNDRAANGGTLTNQEKQQVNREQNGASRQIYNDNHNANAIGANQTNTREANQEQRIANGQRSGQMTSGEAARAQQSQANVAGQTHADRTANGGGMNNQQRQQINQQQNQASRQIYNENHNGAQARPAPAPRQQPQARPAPAPRPQPQARPAPAPHAEAPRGEGGKPR